MKRCTWTSPAVTCGDLQSWTKTQQVYQYVGEYRLEAWRRWHELPPKLEYLRNQATDHFLFFWRTITHWYTNFRFYPNFINSRCARSSLSGSHIKKTCLCNYVHSASHIPKTGTERKSSWSTQGNFSLVFVSYLNHLPWHTSQTAL